MLAIIPARGGSKRLHGKNVKLLNGKPLIAYTIEAALASPSIEKVFVSTDDIEIAEVAKKFGAIVPELRPQYLASDTASSNDVIKYGFDLMKELYNETFVNCILLQPTSPFRVSKNIEEAISLFKSRNADAVISFTKESHPLKWNKYLSQEGVLESISCLEDRTSYYPNGAIYVLSKKVVLEGNYYTGKTFGYIMDRKFSVDIDTQDDWDYAEYLMRL